MVLRLKQNGHQSFLWRPGVINRYTCNGAMTFEPCGLGHASLPPGHMRTSGTVGALYKERHPLSADASRTYNGFIRPEA